jgi:hypothetical protein
MYKYAHIFCKQILQCLTSCNFIQCINAQMKIWSSLLSRSTHKDLNEIYFILFSRFIPFFMHFRIVLDFSGNLERKMKIKKLGTVQGQPLAHGLRPGGCRGLARPVRRKATRARFTRPTTKRKGGLSAHRGR